MEFGLSADQQLLRDNVRRYCRENYRFTQRAQGLRSREGFQREHWKAFAQLGWLGAALPGDVGGAGGSAIDTALILEEFGRVLVLEPYLSCVVLAAHAINSAASMEQRRYLLAPMLKGELLVALAHFESEARGEPGVVETRARRTADGGYVLSGRKSLVPGGGGADWLVVSARTSADARLVHRTSLFLVRPDAAGVVRRVFRSVDGHRYSEILLAEAAVDQGALLGEEGEAFPSIEDAIDRAVVGVCAEAVGAMDSVVTITRDYLKTRRAYGSTLSTLQALQHRLAEMLVEQELSRSILYRALAGLESSDREFRRKAVSGAKAFIGRSGRFVGSYGVQLHGGLGMSDDYIIGHLFKRLSVIETLFGNSEFHLNRAFDAEQRRAENAAQSCPIAACAAAVAPN